MVVTREEPPYVMVKCPNCTGRERYEGFAIDLLQAISEVGFLGSVPYYLTNSLQGCWIQLHPVLRARQSVRSV